MQVVSISGSGFVVDAKTRTYIEKKVLKLIGYIPRHARKSATANVTVQKNGSRGKENIKCTIIMNLPNKQLVAEDQRDGALAAIDGAEHKLASQIRRYKVELLKAREQEGVLGRVKRILNKKK